jgi:hypothetical protein
MPGCRLHLGPLVALPGLWRQRRVRMVNRVYVETVRTVQTLVMIL